MAFTSWRGLAGQVHPTMRPGSSEELNRLLPDGMSVLSLHCNIRRGTADEFKTVMAEYERHIAELAEQACEVITPSGAPPFMVQGFKKEAKLIDGWEKKYKVPMFTSGQNHIHALKALKAKSFVGATYFPGKINDVFARYFEDAGFKVKAMDGMDVAFDKAQELSPYEVYAYVKKSFLKNKGADAIYMLGGGWRTLDIVAMLEQDLQVPVVHPTVTRVWEFQKRLYVNAPMKGFGWLLENLPALPA
jgi:maleate cis-trans isomerase